MLVDLGFGVGDGGGVAPFLVSIFLLLRINNLFMTRNRKKGEKNVR